MADSNVLREYLVSLGFKVSQSETKKFSNTLTSLDKTATNLGRAVVGVGVAAATMVTQFAHQMEKLYYASKLASTSAGNLRAFTFGAEQIGISGPAATQALQSMAMAIRQNPGLIGFINSLGVSTKGRTVDKVFVDLVKVWGKMPFEVASRQAQNYFGISPETLFLAIDGSKQLEESMERRKQLAQDMGVDVDKAAQAGKEYAQEWRDIIETMKLAKDVILIGMLEPMKELAGVTKAVLADWITIIAAANKAKPGETGSFGDNVEKVLQYLGYGLVGNSSVSVWGEHSGVELSAESKRRLYGAAGEPPAVPGSVYDYTNRAMRGMGYHSRDLADMGTTTGDFARFDRSGVSPGPGWGGGIRRRNREYEGDSGYYSGSYGSESAMARAAGGLAPMPTPGNDDPAYNLKQVEAELARKGLNPMQRSVLINERDRYADMLTAEGGAGASSSISQTNTVTITGVSDPVRAAQEYEVAQQRLNADLIRNNKPRVK